MEHILKTNNLSQYISAFTDNNIDTSIFPLLTDDDLKEMGVKIGDRIRLKKLMKQHKQPKQTKQTKQTKQNKQTNMYMDNQNLELQCYELSKKLCKSINKNVILTYINKYGTDTTYRILSYLSLNEIPKDVNLPQDVRNVIYQREEIKARYQYLHNTKPYPNLTLNMLDTYTVKYHVDGLVKNEQQYKLLPGHSNDMFHFGKLLDYFDDGICMKKLLNEITNKQIAHLTYDGYVIAGGILTRIFFGLTKNISSDIDIFLIGDYDEITFTAGSLLNETFLDAL